jgi:hypothetical protein
MPTTKATMAGGSCNAIAHVGSKGIVGLYGGLKLYCCCGRIIVVTLFLSCFTAFLSREVISSCIRRLVVGKKCLDICSSF